MSKLNTAEKVNRMLDAIVKLSDVDESASVWMPNSIRFAPSQRDLMNPWSYHRYVNVLAEDIACGGIKSDKEAMLLIGTHFIMMYFSDDEKYNVKINGESDPNKMESDFSKNDAASFRRFIAKGKRDHRNY